MKMMRILSLAVCLCLCVQVAGAALVDGLVGYYQFEDNLLDTSGNSHDATARDGNLGYATGVLGQALDVNGDVAQPGSWDPSAPNGQLSISFWAKFDTTSGVTNTRGLVAKRVGGGADQYMFFASMNGSSNTVSISGANYQQVNSTLSLSDGNWHHVVFSFDGTNLSIYTDGTLDIGPTAWALNPYPGLEMAIGRQQPNWGGSVFPGWIDEVGFWNRPLSSSEAAALYNSGAGALPFTKDAVNISPADGAENVIFAPSLDLQWKDGGAAEKGDEYTLYFDDSNDISSPLYSEVVVYDGNDMSVTITDHVTLAQSTPYYWKVNDPNGPGAIWSFTTATSLYISGQPVSIDDALLGDDVDFTVEIVADNGVASVDWRMMIDDVNSVSLLVDTSGSTTSTLSLTDLDGTEEGDYFAVVTDGASGQVTSDIASLNILNDMLAHWKLDNDMLDSVGSADLHFRTDGFNQNDGAATYDPNGAIDQGIILDGAGNYLIEYSHLQPDADSGQFSIAMWVKWNGDNAEAETWQGLADYHYYDGDGQAFGFIVDEDTDKLGVKSGSNSTPLLASTTLPTGEWVQAVLTYNGTNAQIWQDGVKVLDEAFSYSPRTADTRAVYGAATDRDKYNFYGNLDDIKLFNYPLSADEIILEYFDVTGNYGCSGNPEFDTSGPEGTPDCKVDLYDFVDFAGGWLDCNRIPAEACN